MSKTRRVVKWLRGMVVVFIFLARITHAGELTVSWNANTESDLKGYKIYYGTASQNYNTVVDVGNVVNYSLNGLAEGQVYFFAVTAYDTAHNESGFSEEVSAQVQVNDVTPPTLYAVDVVNASLLYLTFSEEVERASAENVSNYQINNNVTILSVRLAQGNRIVHIETAPHQAGAYSIVVNNIRDLATSPNSIAANSSLSYEYIPDDFTPPSMTEVRSVDETHVDVTFSEEIERSTAETTGNFKINNGITIQQVSLDQNNRTVHLVTNAHENGVTYILTVNKVRDVSVQHNEIPANSSLSYTYYADDNVRPYIYSVTIRNENLVDVVFSEKITEASAEAISNFQINNNIAVLVAILDNDQKTVHLSTTSHLAGGNYVLTVNNIMDMAQVPNSILPNSIVSYSYNPDDTAPPQISLTESVDATHLRLTFSEALDRESAELENNYKINKGVSVIEAVLDASAKIIQLVTTAHTSGETYVLTINNVKDQAPAPNAIAANTTAEYTYIYQDVEPPQVTNVDLIDLTHLEITFNEIVERESAELVANYSISDDILIFGAVLDNDLKIVQLTTSAHEENKTYTLTVNKVRDRSDHRNEIVPNSNFIYSLESVTEERVAYLNKESYQLAYLNVGDAYYIDRDYTITSIPDAMTGFMWISTANDDRGEKEEGFLSFKLSETSKVYVAYDSRAANYPNWLVRDFHRVGKSIGVSEYAKNLDLWEGEFDSGMVVLGGNMAEGSQGVESMYVVLIESENSLRPQTPENMSDPSSLGPADMFLLYQNYPNPFNAGTEIRFQLPKNVYVELTIYNILGQTIRTLVQGHKNAGHHLLQWDGKNSDGLIVPSGVYFSRLIIKRQELLKGRNIDRILYNNVRKMLMVK
ncbi:MAG: FlgD immunoglobulin-like domain containing protein [Candidatus Zhuqueibacterota bacterium]